MRGCVVAVSLLLCALPARAADGFAGLWNTSFGRMRLVQDGNKVTGIYNYAGGSTIEGTVDGNKFTFRYKEPAAQGERVFELASDGRSFRGTWKASGQSATQPWTGERMAPKPGVT